MTDRVMLDLETLGLEPGAAICSLGAVRFNATELRTALADFSDDQPLSIDHNGVELKNVIVHDDGDRVVLY